ncbi:MAG: hypothetical protein WCF68_20510 [Terriglobales bacterium]
MAAAHNIPYDDTLVAQNITINNTFTPTPHQGFLLGVGQPITFTNNSGVEISSIQFQANPPLPSNPGPILYPNTITSLANGATSAELSPNYPEGSVNYLIIDESGNQYGPFSIQLGTAVPLMIAILDAQTYPETAAVPAKGNAAIYSADSPCVQYGISWGGNGNPFSASVPKAACGYSSGAIRTANNNPDNYLYTIINPAQGPGGKIIIQN